VLTAHRPLLRETAFGGGPDGQSIAGLTATMTKGVGTLLWMAPELFRGGSKYGPEVDVYVAMDGSHAMNSHRSGGCGRTCAICRECDPSHVHANISCRYSYGVILWELATRMRPWDQIEEQQYIRFYAALSAALEAGERPEIPPSVVESQPDFVALMRQCWGNIPASRPPFDEVVRALGEPLPAS
jgi:serine/threonine protein kinase